MFLSERSKREITCLSFRRQECSPKRAWGKCLIFVWKILIKHNLLSVESCSACRALRQSYGGWWWIVHPKGLLPVLGYCHRTALKKARNTTNFNKVHPRIDISVLLTCFTNFIRVWVFREMSKCVSALLPSRTLVHTYRNTWCLNPEYHTMNPQDPVNLKPHKPNFCFLPSFSYLICSITALVFHIQTKCQLFEVNVYDN
jgi:hypothetical protein